MKIGCCLNMHSTFPDGIGMEWLDTTVNVGYDYIELPLAQIMTLDESAFSRLVKKVADLGISCEACNNFLPSYLKITGYVDNTAVMAYVNQAFERVATLGAQVVVFGSGASRSVPDGMDIDTAMMQLADFLTSLIDLLEKFDITVVIEPLRVQESNIINTLNDAVWLMKAVGHPRIRLLSDNFHMAFAGETPEMLNLWGKYIRHAHFCRVEGRIIPKYSLTLDERNYIYQLSNNTDCPRISVESFSDNFEADSREVITLIRDQLSLM